MGEGGISLLAGWESFYVIIGTAAAALTGLQFIVITVGAQMNRGDAEANRAFGTPTIIHFCAVLFIAAIISAPWPSLADIAVILSFCGIAGLIYAAMILRIVRRQTAYKPVLEDWIWHFTLPPIGYAMLLLAAIRMQRSPIMSLFEVAGTALLFLFIGIHNSWDSVTFITLQQRPQMQEQTEPTSGSLPEQS